MKKKKFNKKLVLNKKTIANLTTKELDNLKGGGGDEEPTWDCSDLYCKATGIGENSVCICW